MHTLQDVPTQSWTKKTVYRNPLPLKLAKGGPDSKRKPFPTATPYPLQTKKTNFFQELLILELLWSIQEVQREKEGIYSTTKTDV